MAVDHSPTRVLIPEAVGHGPTRAEQLFRRDGVAADYLGCTGCTVTHPTLGIVPMPWKDAVRNGHPGPARP